MAGIQFSYPDSEGRRHFLMVAAVFIAIIMLVGLVPSEAQSQTTRVCDPQIYHGVQHCTDDGGDTHLLLVDLANPHVRVQTVLPINEATGEECNSVNSSGHPIPDSNDPTSNCPYLYPRETVEEMLIRYVNGFRVNGYAADREPVAIINTDYFGFGNHGAQGLTVRNGERLDGPAHNDYDCAPDSNPCIPLLRGSTQPSLAISDLNTALIGIPASEEEINSSTGSTYFNTVGGAPIIVEGSAPVNPNCTYPYPGDKCADPAQSAAGVTDDGRLILISAKKSAPDIANYLIDNHRVQTALKFDGGGSTSMAWVNAQGEVIPYCSADPDEYDSETGEPKCREISEGLLIFSEKIQPTETVDVALIIDSSGSMTSNDPDNRRLTAARAYLKASVPGDYVAVVDFDSLARVASFLQRLPDNEDALIDAINSINSSGGTNIGYGLQTGCLALTDPTSGNTTKAAILLTDGQGAFDDQDLCFADRGWRVFTFGFGNANDALLSEIATNTGGEFKRLPTEDFVCEFVRVRSTIAGGDARECMSLLIGPLEIIRITTEVQPGQSQSTFTTFWAGSDVEMTLTAPSGRVIGRDTMAPDVVHDLTGTSEIYTILNPEPGTWEVSLYGRDVPPEGEEVVFGFTSIPSPVINVDVDVKPGSEPNSINCTNGRAVIPVAILTTEDFDALTVAHGTVLFEGAAETHVDGRTKQPRRHEEDVDGDGDIDLVFHFRLDETNLSCDSMEGTVTGETMAGEVIQGTDSLRMITPGN